MNKKAKEKQKVKANKGITLIALVVTIVVLIILAGITIASLTGEKGIIKEARTAKEQTEQSSLEEQVELAIIKAEQKYKNPTLDNVIEELKNNKVISNSDQVNKENGDITTDLGYLIKGKLDDYLGDGSGTESPVVPSFDENTFTLGTNESDAKNTDKYGWKVPEYTVQTSEMSTNVWRLFYQDENYAYLITDECVGNYKPSDYTTMKNGDELKYQTGADVSKVGQKLSPKISTLFTSSNERDQIRTTAWLTDCSSAGAWTEYNNGDSVFAIGSPTAELFVASYNNRSNKSSTITLDVDERFGYTSNASNNDGWMSVGENKGIYARDSSSEWMLASPAKQGTRSNAVMTVAGQYSCLSETLEGYSYGVRPIVCIPTSVFNSDYTLENT